MAETSCSGGTPAGPTLGVHSDMTYFRRDAEHAALADAAQSVAARVSRNSLLWDLVEPTRGTRDWRVVDSVVAALEARGIAPLFTVVGSPAWASGADPKAPDARFQVPRDPARFAAWLEQYAGFVDEAARRYGSRVRKWELWNEPNEHWFWKPAPDAAQYVAWARRMQAVIEHRIPGAEIAVGALTGLTHTAPGNITGTAFLEAIYKAGLRPRIVSIHPYAMRNQAPETTLPYENNFTDIEAVRAVMLRHGQADAAIWATEWGWPSRELGEQAQAAHLDRSLQMLVSRYPYVRLAVYFLARDTGPYTHGLFARDGRMRPAAEVFRGFSSSLPAPAAAAACEQGFLLPGADGFDYAEAGPAWMEGPPPATLPPWVTAAGGIAPPDAAAAGFLLEPGASQTFLPAPLIPP